MRRDLVVTIASTTMHSCLRDVRVQIHATVAVGLYLIGQKRKSEHVTSSILVESNKQPALWLGGRKTTAE